MRVGPENACRLTGSGNTQLKARTAGSIRGVPNGMTAAVPAPDKSRTMRGPDAVDAHPRGASPFGVMDMVGNVWQWTEEFVDEHTRGGILRGGSYDQPQGSICYFPQAYKLNEHGKLLLMSPSMDRPGAIGFRCVVDSQ
jgi:gamma-glutamyl hercynylcysteine S-oxide synthase